MSLKLYYSFIKKEVIYNIYPSSNDTFLNKKNVRFLRFRYLEQPE